MQRARREEQPILPDSVKEWGDMIASDEWSQRYMNVIGNRNIVAINKLIHIV